MLELASFLYGIILNIRYKLYNMNILVVVESPNKCASIKKYLNNFKGEKIIMAMKENSKKVLNYLKEVNGSNVTAADVAEALGLEKRSVDGIFTSAIQRKGLGIRTPAEVEVEDGTHKAVKFLSLTPAGMSFDPDAADAE